VLRSLPRFPGGLTARATPVPIPNTEVKPRRADDTALETTRERRSPPGIKFKGRSALPGGLFYLRVTERGGRAADASTAAEAK
jgi:hypothetical protein